MTDSNIQKMIQRYPHSKIREHTKIREILQQTALLGLERHGFFEKAAFYGGTALRILYGLDRFSEDLDFTLLKPDPEFNFARYLTGMQEELAGFGFEMQVEEKKKNIETNIVSAFLKANTLELYLNISGEKKAANHNEQIQIKLEVDTDPPSRFRVENRLVLNPTSFYVLTLHKNDLFAGKMHALLFRAWKGRVKGRDWYDLIWYIQNRIPLSLVHLEERMKQTGSLGPNESLDRSNLIKLLQTKIQKIDWESAKADIRPFIADPGKLDIWSANYFLDIIPHLITE